MTIDNSENEDGGAGGTSLEGYEYQIDVSIWIALDLILALRAAPELQLEPPSQEDAEADMSLASTLVVDSYRLVVQAKLRSGDAWSVRAVESLLKHGTRRAPVQDRLKDQSIRYLLITSAGLNGGTRGMSVRRPGLWPRSEDMPPTIAKLLGDSAGGRVAIIGSLDELRLRTHIKELLIETFRVPTARWFDCWQVLRNETRVRIRGGGSGRWLVEDLQVVIRDHGGYIANSRELEHYVHPTNWADLKQILKQRHAAVIIGQSGTGKSMATKQLYAELRQSIPGLSRVVVTRGPQQINEDHTAPPVLFDIEDPWGRFDFEPQNRSWNDQLAHYFSNASPTRIFIATSRLDVAQSSGAYDTVKPWVFTLEAEHYGRNERVALYRTRIAALPRPSQALATIGEPEVLQELTTPLEIQKFFDALITFDQTDILKNSLECRRRAIAQAHQDSIERTVVEQIGQRDDERAAAVIWALLRANDKLSLTALRKLEDKLADLDGKFDKGVQPLVGFFIAARNLRQSNDVVAYYHPRVEAGIEKTMRAKAPVVRRALRTLIDALVSLDETGGNCGASVAAKVIAACSSRLPDLKPEVHEAAQVGIDAWISTALLCGDRDFDNHLRIAAVAGSTRCNAAEVARFLKAREDGEWGFGLSHWFCLPHDDEWYDRMVADPVARQVVETFVRTSLCNTRVDFDSSFSREVYRLTPDASKAFTEAALNIVRYGVVDNSDVIAYGALQDIQAFEPVIDEAVKILSPSLESLKTAEQLRLDIENDVYSEDYAQHLSENDEGYTAHEFVKAYVERARRIGAWRRIARHRCSGVLLSYWLGALDKEPQPSLEELAEAFSRSYAGDSEGEMWRAFLIVWDSRYAEAAINRVVKGHRERRTQASALFCIVHHNPEQIAGAVAQIREAGDDYRLAEIGIELVEDWGWSAHPNRKLTPATATIDSVIELLPPVIVEITNAAVCLRNKQPVSFTSEAYSLLSGLKGRTLELSELRLKLDAQIKLPIEEDVRRVLEESTESGAAVLAIEAAIRHGMRVEIEAALTHKFAHVVALALQETAGALLAPLPDRFLDLCDARESPIRIALVGILDAKPHPDHLPALLKLVSDEWTSRELSSSDPDYPIAVAAIKAIAKLGALDASVQESLYELALETRDSHLRQRILCYLAKTYGAPLQERLFDIAIGLEAKSIRHAAAQALLECGDDAEPVVVSRITSDLILAAAEPVAARLCLLLAFQGDLDQVVAIAEAMATNRKRRVLLILLIWILAGRDENAARGIAALLPADHPALCWAFGEKLVSVADELLDDLGDVPSVREVMVYVKRTN